MIFKKNKKFNIKGFLVKKKIFKESEISKFERNLITFIYKLTKNYNKNISKSAKLILSYKSKKFRLESIKLLEKIEIIDKNLFYRISKECSDIYSIDNIDNNKKIQKILKKFFNENYVSIQRRKPIMLFNKKDLNRLKYLWHQESQFYPNHNLGLHLWFPIFRNVGCKKDGGMVFALDGHKKNYKFIQIQKKDSWTQKIPKINIEKNFKLFSPNINRGDAIFFTGPQLHKSDDQQSPIPRISFVIRYLSNSKNDGYYRLS